MSGTQDITVTFSLAEWQIVGEGVQMLPINRGLAVFIKLQQLVNGAHERQRANGHDIAPQPESTP